MRFGALTSTRGARRGVVVGATALTALLASTGQALAHVEVGMSPPGRPAHA